MAQLQANVESLQLELSEEVLAEIEAVHQATAATEAATRPG
jgi:aryl-alcohol dehydrogenase-like predicted oxidoreductase